VKENTAINLCQQCFLKSKHIEVPFGDSVCWMQHQKNFFANSIILIVELFLYSQARTRRKAF